MKAVRNIDNSKLERAEELVTESLTRLEHVMEEITDRVEDASHKMQHLMDLGVRQKDEFLHLKEKAETTVLPVLRQGRDFSRDFSKKITTSARNHQDTLLYSGLFLFAGWMAYRYLAKKEAAYEQDH